MKNELKPCPFCGEKAEYNAWPTDYPAQNCQVYVRCCKCGSEIHIDGKISAICKLKQKVIELWNRRAEPENKPLTWIPVSERLPEKGECLVVHADGTVHFASVIFGEDFKHCIYWVPFPQPPKEANYAK